ncbi:glycosyltransferase family 2 protein [Acidobacteria bacterium AH-259-D05]|nr:glycosyltransferase family 2 protein [Acidobacteria bacterium AH-259-D05]
MAKAILTVLMTVRNGEPYLHEAVSSILNQTYSNFRFLILDNASTDHSREVIRAFKDPRIDLIQLPEDFGQTAALNLGLRMINTPWVTRMDADDVSLPQRLELQMAYLKRHPEVKLLGTGIRFIDGRGHFLRDPELGVVDADVRWRHVIGKGGFAHSTTVFATAAATQAGGYPSQYRYAQDQGLWTSLLDLGRVANIQERLVHCRLHGSSTSDFSSGAIEQEYRAILQQSLCKLFPREPNPTLADVVGALRSDHSIVPSSAIVNCLAALPRRFAAVCGCRPSRSLLRQYGTHWLFMARVTSLRSHRRALRWIKLALQAQPGLSTHMELWHTLASVTLAPLRRRRVWRNLFYRRS